MTVVSRRMIVSSQSSRCSFSVVCVLMVLSGCELFRTQPLRDRTVEPPAWWLEGGVDVPVPLPPAGVPSAEVVTLTAVAPEFTAEIHAPLRTIATLRTDHVELRAPDGFALAVHRGSRDLLRLRHHLQSDVAQTVFVETRTDVLVWSAPADAERRVQFVQLMQVGTESYWCEPANGTSVTADQAAVLRWACTTLRYRPHGTSPAD